MVAREGLEPSKPLGRQIYSLLRLTASLPRQLAVVWKTNVSVIPATGAFSVDGAGEGIRTPDLLITNQLLYQTELRQPNKRGTIARPVPAVQYPQCQSVVRRPAPAELPGPRPPESARFRRCLTASNSTIPVATETFRL